MHKELRDKIRRATEESGIEKPDFLELLHLIDQHYDKMEATITQSLTNTTPMEAIFDSVTEALLCLLGDESYPAPDLEQSLGVFLGMDG